MVKRTIIPITLTCALLLTGMDTKPMIFRPELETYKGKSEVVRNAVTIPQKEKSDYWKDYIEFLTDPMKKVDIPKEEQEVGENTENDRTGDPRGVEDTSTEADAGADIGEPDSPGVDGEILESYLDGADGNESNDVGDGEATEAETLTYAGEWTITFYCDCPECCGQWSGMNSTASGQPPIPWYTVAAGYSYPFGTILYIDGFGYFEVMDRGVSDGWADIFVNNHGEIPSYGMTTTSVYIVG